MKSNSKRFRVGLAALAMAATLSATADAAADQQVARNPAAAFVPPAGFTMPPLHPAGVDLATKRLGEGVYALISSRPPVDNSGFIVGDKGVLVIDAHINGRMARKIQAARCYLANRLAVVPWPAQVVADKSAGVISSRLAAGGDYRPMPGSCRVPQHPHVRLTHFLTYLI